jgi:hypothetical protein
MCLRGAIAAFVASITLFPSSAALIPVTDAHLLFSPYNWVVSSTSAAASNPGASLKFGFSNASSVAIVVNTSDSAAGPCVSLQYSVDDGPWSFTAPNPGFANLSISLATGLSLATSHDVRIYLYASCEQVNGGGRSFTKCKHVCEAYVACVSFLAAQKDRWLRQTAAKGGNAFLIVTGVELNGSTAQTLPPPLVHNATALFFGDSISGEIF